MESKRGFTFLETLVAVILIGVLSALAVKPLKGLVQRIKLQSAANGIKHTIMNARLRAVANPNRLCGVELRLGRPGKKDSVFAFLENNPSDKLYKKGVDSLYLAPFVIDSASKVSARVAPNHPSVIVFRGDGSATASTRVIIALGNMVDTLDVLASTGRVKVVTK